MRQVTVQEFVRLLDARHFSVMDYFDYRFAVSARPMDENIELEITAFPVATDRRYHRTAQRHRLKDAITHTERIVVPEDEKLNLTYIRAILLPAFRKQLKQSIQENIKKWDSWEKEQKAKRGQHWFGLRDL